MKEYLCDSCRFKIELEENISKCPKCGSDSFHVVEDIANNEIDAIIESMLEEAKEEKKPRIINKNENDKCILLSDDNYSIEKNNDKCINCGQCKKVCENIANLTYDLNICNNPICTGCGQCVLSCPTKALSIKSEYRKVKQIMDANEKIVIAILSPSVFLTIGKIYNIDDISVAEKKTIGILRKIGFDYIFSSSFGSDLLSFEESFELIERISKKEKLPLFTSSCPSWIKYAEIYHPELLNNLSYCKTPIEMEDEIIKNYFCEKKGFDRKRIVTVSISNCSAYKLYGKEKNVNTDYFITTNELLLLIKDEDIDLKTIDSSNYDSIVGEISGSGYLSSVSGGQTESIIRTVYRVINKKDLAKDEIDIYELRGNEDIREATINTNSLKLKVAVVTDMKSLEKLLENSLYKQYHLIEVSFCKGGCINGGGQAIYENCNNIENIKDLSEKIYLLDKNSKNRFVYNNKELKEIYKKYLENPGSNNSKKIFQSNFENKKVLLGKE